MYENNFETLDLPANSYLEYKNELKQLNNPVWYNLCCDLENPGLSHRGTLDVLDKLEEGVNTEINGYNKFKAIILSNKIN